MTTPGSPNDVVAGTSGLARLCGFTDRRGFLTPVWQSLVTGLVFVAVSLAAFHSPTPRGARIDVVGSPAAAAGIRHGLDAALPGGFDVHSGGTADAALRRLRHGDSFAVVDTATGTLSYAGANGPTVTAVVTKVVPGVLARGGTTVSLVDARPLHHDDAAGLPLFYLVFGVVLASYLFTVTSVIAGSRLPARGHWSSAALLALSLGGLATLVARFAVHALGADPALVWLLLSLTSLGTSSASWLFIRSSRTIGSLLASAVLVVVASAAGGVLPGPFLPTWLAALRPALPLGAGLAGVRAVTYFDGQHLAAAAVVLALWAVLPLLIAAALDHVRRPSTH